MQETVRLSLHYPFLPIRSCLEVWRFLKRLYSHLRWLIYLQDRISGTCNLPSLWFFCVHFPCDRSPPLCRHAA